MTNHLPNVWVIRGNFGQYTDAFLRGGYCGIGWLTEHDLTHNPQKDELATYFRAANPEGNSASVVGTQVGQIFRFIAEVKIGDTVIVPAGDSKQLFYGRVTSGVIDTPQSSDGCPYRHRRTVEWAASSLIRQELSIPLQNTLRATLTVFSVAQKEEFYTKIGTITATSKHHYDPYTTVLEQILELSASDFEVLVGHLLTALGFDGSEVTGKPGDGGIDARGVLNVSGLAQMDFYVQAKRYKIGTKISATVVKALRASIPNQAFGAFISTADYQKAAYDVASEKGFPPIGLINGSQLVDLLIKHWNDLPVEFRELLGLKPGLVVVR